MGKRFWLALAAAALIVAAVPASAAARPESALRGLDYLHAQQQSTGGFGTASGTAWSVIALVASGERPGWSVWRIGGNSPITYLQTVNHETTAPSSGNSPVYYSLMVLGYVAGGREDLAYAAGTPPVDLLARLETYQDRTDGSPTYGSYSPSPSNPENKAVRTTSWALLAMNALGISEGNVRVAPAVQWLQDQARADGGFPTEPGGSSTVVDTALAVQALRAGGVSASAGVIQQALDYLQSVQLASGGFPDADLSDTRLDGEATSAAIQAILAAGEDPSSARWTRSGGDPFTALRSLQRPSGAFQAWRGVLRNAIPITAHAVTALMERHFGGRFPAEQPPSVTAFVAKPRFREVAPRDKAKFTQTRTVLIRALYSDGEKGTGINVRRVRLFVDSVDRSRPADIGKYGLHLQLKNVANGQHTFKIVLVDNAGNSRTLERTFTVAVAVPPTTPTLPPSSGGGYVPTRPPTTYTPPAVVRPTTTPTPSTTLSPYPTPTASAYPWASPSPSPSPSPSLSGVPSPAAGGTDDDGNGAGLLGATLLAMLPVGAALSYYLLQRRAHALAAASDGQTLSGGGTGWEHLKDTASRSKDVIKPAGS
jgi:hypothetical protein